MIALPFASFIFLIGLFWNIKPLQTSESDEDQTKARQKQARLGLLRAMLLLGGFLLMAVSFIGDLAGITAWDSLGLLAGTYGFILLLVQRSEVNRRLATLLVLAPLWLILIPRYAAYRDWESESNWGVMAALGLNYLFWLTIGRRFPVGSSQEIVVWGMDTQ